MTFPVDQGAAPNRDQPPFELGSSRPDTDRPRWVVLEPYYGGSHRQLIDDLIGRLPVDFSLLTLPPRKWKWRMRGAALQFARELVRGLDSEQLADRWDGLFVTSLLDVAALRGLLPAELRALPIVMYCHENQLCYPVQVHDKRDYHYAWTNIQSLLAADRVLWNSCYNRDSFLAALPEYLDRLPDARPRGLVEAILAKSQVLPVPIDLGPLQAARERWVGSEGAPPRVPRIVWNHRWEHDKGPDEFFEALTRLSAAGRGFELAVLGQSFVRRPACFERAAVDLDAQIVTWGFQESREDYLQELARADFVVSTARHEFQGLSVLEAATCGAVPVVPDDLAYQEIWPPELRYPPGSLFDALIDRFDRLDEWRSRCYHGVSRDFGWSSLFTPWRQVFYAPGCSEPVTEVSGSVPEAIGSK